MIRPPIEWVDWKVGSFGNPANVREKKSSDGRFVIYNFTTRSGDRYRLFDAGRFVMRGGLNECQQRAEEIR